MTRKKTGDPYTDKIWEEVDNLRKIRKAVEKLLNHAKNESRKKSKSKRKKP